MESDEAYEVLRKLTSPIVALTCRRGEKLNGMIANSAVRASVVPDRQRVAIYIFKRHLSHDIVAATGRFAMHLLARDQWEEAWSLGFRSGRDAEKLEGLPHRISGETGLPILTRSYAWMECDVVNAMDGGASTFFMGQIARMGRGSGADVMTSAYFRAEMPPDWRDPYRVNLGAVQDWAAERQEELDDEAWRRLRARHGGGAPPDSEAGQAG